MKKDIFCERAKEYRLKGYSFNEISKIFKISKSTASLWLRNIPLTEDGRKRLKKISDLGREKAISTNKRKREEILKKINSNCKVLRGREYGDNDLKLFLSLMYWGEGGKTGRRVSFMNSDPAMIKSYLFLFRKAFAINENKIKLLIHIHPYHDENELINFWSRTTGVVKDRIRIYRNKNSGKNIKKDYKGCVAVNYNDTKIFSEIDLIIKRFIYRFAKCGLS
jgi:transcriptional regulator with XRE-family HTH domain